MTEENSLVSIIVITYNSSRYVLETLESAKAQTYHNIELIVSDDCSADNTVEICREWMEENKERFVRTDLITVEKNTGIAPNCNRGVRAAQGVWVKLIAGDDALESEIIQKFIEHILINPWIRCIYSNVREYNDKFIDNCLLPTRDLKSLPINQPNITAESQFNILLRSNTIWASTLMFNRNTILDIGGFNEKYPFFEDRPILIALTKSGLKIYYIDIWGAKYRRHNFSVQTNKSKEIFLSRFREDNQRYFINECLQYYSKNEQWLMIYRYKKDLWIKKVFSNHKNKLILGISYMLDILPKFYFSIKK